MATRVLIVDDHLAIREGIRSLLAPEGDFVVVGEAVDGNDGIAKALALKPDLIVLDNSMPGKTGLEVARELRTQLPEASIVFLTLDPGIKDLALAVGAAGHISKDTPPLEMLKVLRQASKQQERRSSAPELSAKERELGQALLLGRVITDQQLDTLIASRKPRELLSAAVLRSQLVPDAQLAQIFASVSGRPLMSLAPHAGESAPSTSRLPRRGSRKVVDPIDPTVARQLPRRFSEQHRAVLVTFGRSAATLALADPLDEQTRREVQDMLAGIATSVVVATPSDIDAAIIRAFGAPTSRLVALPTNGAHRKSKRRPFAAVAAIAAVFLLFATGLGITLAPSLAGVQARGQLTIFQGTVEYHRAGGQYAAASTGQLIREGDSVRTTASGHAAITFFDDTVVVFEPSTQIEVVSLRTAGSGDIDATLRQSSGKTWHVVTHQQTTQGKYIVLTPAAQTQVVGTAFQVRVDAQTGATTVTTTDGLVRTNGVGENASSTVTVAAGNTTTVSTKGAAPQTPVATTQVTLTFVLDDARDAVVVTPNGEASGVRAGEIIRYIPGSVVTRVEQKVTVTMPAESDRYATLTQPADATAKDVHVSTELRTSTGTVAGRITDAPLVVANVAKSGVAFTSQGLVTLGTTVIEQFPQPVVAAAPPSPSFDPFGFLRATNAPVVNAGPAGAEGAPGPAGPPGPSGPSGPTGSAGPTGAPGTDGAAGLSGVNGTPGASGAPGINGIDGAPGASGAAGPAGANGAQGPVGPAGSSTGVPGPTGPTGAAGANGTNGVNGATGPTGAAGTNGTNGTNGVDGATGPTGAAGAAGVAGPTGPTGSTGAAGTNGTNGVDGATGPTGAAGTNGTNGTNGVDGATGPTGAAGTNGTNGADGATGPTGTAGAAGVAGPTGPTGAAGANGTNGTNGADGATGATGAAGTNGTNGADGATGATGAAGMNGTNGTNGADGATGATGAAGTNGTNGTNGIDGATGATGATGTVGSVTDGTTTATNPSSISFSNGFAVTQPGGAGTAAVVDGSGFVHRTGNINETVNGQKEFTGDSTGNDTVKITPTGNLASGSALNINTGASAPGVGNTQGVGLNVNGSGAFGGDFVRIQNSGAFTGTLVNLVANTTATGTVLGISAPLLTTGKAVDIQLGALYSGTGALGAVNVQAGAFTGNIFSVSSNATGQNASSNLASLQSPQTVGRLLYVNATGAYTGAGAVELALGGGGGTGLLINAAAGYTGNFVELKLGGSSVFSVSSAGSINTAGGITTAGSFSQTGGASTFSTGGGQVSLNGNTVLADGKSFTAGGTASVFNFSASSSQFDTSSGTVNLNGNTVLALNKSLTVAAGSNGAIDFGNSSGAFTTTTGANTLRGNTTVVDGKTFAVGTAANTLTTQTAADVRTGNGLTTGKALNIDTGTSAFSTNGATALTSTGNFTGTLARLTANSTTAGTVLGVTATGLTTGKAVQVDLGTALYTGTGAIDVTANSATTGTLASISGTTLGANNGTGLKVAVGTPSGADPVVGKAISVALGGAGGGTGVYVNSATGYTGNLLDLRINAVSVFSVSNTTISTSLNFAQSGASATFATGGGAVSLNGDTAVATAKTFTASQGVTSGTGSSFTTASGLTTGQLVAISTGTSTFSTAGGALGITGTGAFTGTLAQLTGNSTTAGTVLGISATALSTNGEALAIVIGTETGTPPTTAKAIRLALGTAGTGLYTNAGTGYTGNFIQLQLNAVDKFVVNQLGSTTIAIGGSLTIGGTGATVSTPITGHLSTTASIDIASMQNACVSTTVTVTGAATGDTVVANPTPVAGGIETLDDVYWMAFVSAANTVTIRSCEGTNNARNPGAQTWRVDVWRH